MTSHRDPLYSCGWSGCGSELEVAARSAATRGHPLEGAESQSTRWRSAAAVKATTVMGRQLRVELEPSSDGNRHAKVEQGWMEP